MKAYLSETTPGTGTVLIKLKSVVHGLELPSVKHQYFLVLCQRSERCKLALTIGKVLRVLYSTILKLWTGSQFFNLFAKLKHPFTFEKL